MLHLFYSVFSIELLLIFNGNIDAMSIFHNILFIKVSMGALFLVHEIRQSAGAA